MLGEGARTYEDANKYFENYKNVIKVIYDSSSEKNIVFQSNYPLRILDMRESN